MPSATKLGVFRMSSSKEKDSVSDGSQVRVRQPDVHSAINVGKRPRPEIKSLMYLTELAGLSLPLREVTI